MVATTITDKAEGGLATHGNQPVEAASYYRARYYDPSSGRFLREDPVKFSAGMNFYAYVKNEPIDFADPYGLKCVQVTPWQEIPTMSAPGSAQPYLTLQIGNWWVSAGWDYANGQEGSTPISCICYWVASHTRLRKFYREKVEEEAWFECTNCNGTSSRKRETRKSTRYWDKDVMGTPFLPILETKTSGGTVTLHNGEDTCMCAYPTP